MRRTIQPLFFSSLWLAAFHACAASVLDIRSPDGTVIITADTIQSYDWSKHMLMLAPDARRNLYSKLAQTESLVSGRPFAVCVDGKTIYTGKFITSTSSFSLDTPVIVVNPVSYKDGLRDNELVIQLGYPNNEFFNGNDPRGDKRISDTLRAAGKLTPPCEDHAKWIAKALREIQSVKPGMTREDLLKDFTEDGGLSSRVQRRYVYRAAPIIKVDVKFEVRESEANNSQEHLKDKITHISAPFLEWPIMD